MASFPQSANGFTVVTHGYPQQSNQAFNQVGPNLNRSVSPPSSPLGNFLKGQPSALGTIQIMIGVVVLLFGIVTTPFSPSVSVISGIMFWGAIIYIITGSLTVQANKRLTHGLVNASLGMSIVSAMTSAAGIIIYSLDIAVIWYPMPSCLSSDYYCILEAGIYLSRIYGTAGVMLVLSILDFIISICVSAFACKATCSSGTRQVIYQTPHFSPNPIPAMNIPEMPRYQNPLPRFDQSGFTGLKPDRPGHQSPIYNY